MEGVTLKPFWLLRLELTLGFLLLPDHHFGYPCGDVAILPQKKRRRMHKNLFYTPTHSGETWHEGTQIGLSDGYDGKFRRARGPDEKNELYFGPPPPSGTVHWMSCIGTLTSQSLQWMQF
ncbi:hypothetical protein EI94DRAFT_1715321 [Lactarius quietus]|nr:hypothetical protein EI94DRAFT_1715321 [Lactarius quietus]